ncbi:MAG: hypothetical protein QOD36_1325 [Mycobacterium sp.]|jgi:hypothetical protein|nr:hypothetical protein [Mycobacterium sp.]MDT5329168.1 hypothetical protein [Mycobacterium sp.]
MGDLQRFDAPARLRDITEDSPFFDAWQPVIDDLIQDRVNLSGQGNSVDPSHVALDVGERRTFTWTGFPRPLLVTHRDDRARAFEEGDRDRQNQPEYLEWFVSRTGDKISRVDFSCETPEYYRTLAQAEPDQLLPLYKRVLDTSAVKRADLFSAGAYRPDNKWNTTQGIVHYIMRINSMGDLLGVQQETPSLPEDAAADAEVLDGYDPLPYFRQTAADARMNWDSWAITRTGQSVATIDAPGLYMIDWDDTGFEKPDGTPVDDYWTVERGEEGAALRLRYEVPEAEEFLVGDIRIGGRPITTGGQIAEHIVMAAHIVVGVEQ